MVSTMRKNKILAILALPLLLASCGEKNNSSKSDAPSSQESSVPFADTWDVSSQDGTIKVQLFQEDGYLKYKVEKNNVTVINPSKLGMVFEGTDLSMLLEYKNVARDTVTYTYNSISGKRKTNTVTYNEMTVTFLEYNYYLDVTFRLFNDGYAFRYGIRKASDSSESTLTWTDEATEFSLPAKVSTYAMAYTPSGNKDGYYWYSYEDYFAYRRSDRMDGQYSMPMLYQADKDSNIYSLITESQLIGSGYHGSFLAPIEENSPTLKTVYPNAHGKNPDYTVDVSNGFESPWRVGIVGDLKTIVESNLVEDVYGETEYYKPDNYSSLKDEEKAIYDYSWVEPDVTAWNWLYYTGSISQDDWTLQKKYIDLAADMGWKYSLIDGGWQGSHSATEIKELTTYAHNKGVKIIAWGHAFNEFGTEALMRSKLKTWKSYGIDGLKVDFWDGQGANVVPDGQVEDKQTIELYEKFYKMTAEYQMVVNCHGANKPTGERRKYPHVINREAIRGNEFKSVSTAQTVFDTFIRAVVGPSDFTPVVKPFRKGITAAHQMALNIMYESGTPSMADVETRYKQENYIDFFKELPATWDEIKYIEGDVENYAVLARRNGNDWWIGGITCDSKGKDVNLNLDFLGEGNYAATYYSDNGTTGSDSTVALSAETITKGKTKSMHMDANGGFAIKIIKK